MRKHSALELPGPVSAVAPRSNPLRKAKSRRFASTRKDHAKKIVL